MELTFNLGSVGSGFKPSQVQEGDFWRLELGFFILFLTHDVTLYELRNLSELPLSNSKSRWNPGPFSGACWVVEGANAQGSAQHPDPQGGFHDVATASFLQDCFGFPLGLALIL